MTQAYDIVIVGAGTAGLSAAIYGLRSGKKVLVLEQAMYGGQIINTPAVENYPGVQSISGYEFAEGLYQQAKSFGMEFKSQEVKEICKADAQADSVSSDENKTYWLVNTSKEQYLTRTVILAVGSENRKLGIANELKFTGRGVSYCATCDGAFFKGKSVAVYGGGNTALEDALYLSQYCEKVYLIHRRNQFRGEKHLEEQLRKADNVEFILQKKVIDILGEKNVQELRLEDTESGTISSLKVDGLFVAIGQEPKTSAFANLVTLDSRGYIVAGEDCETGVPGIFAAGDCRTKQIRQLTTAASDGAVAALAASRF